jgi:hypothetical protein
MASAPKLSSDIQPAKFSLMEKGIVPKETRGQWSSNSSLRSNTPDFSSIDMPVKSNIRSELFKSEKDYFPRGLGRRKKTRKTKKKSVHRKTRKGKGKH